MKSKGLNTDPWCTPTLTGNATLSPSPSLIAVDALSYIAWITLTSHSSTPNFLSAHQTTSRGTLSKAFSRSTKAIHISCFLVKNLSCICLTMKMASVVPRPGLKPNCILSICTLFLTLFSITRSRTFITWSNNLMPRYDPHSKALPLPLYMLTIQLFLQSCGIFPSVTTALHRSVIHCISTSPAAFNISATTPLGPGAFPNLAFFIATFTSSKVIPSHSPGTLLTYLLKILLLPIKLLIQQLFKVLLPYILYLCLFRNELSLFVFNTIHTHYIFIFPYNLLRYLINLASGFCLV